MLTPELQHLPLDKPIRLRNSTCIYCRATFGKALTRTKEHVIGRNFVPSGALQSEWNLIANACQKCNNEKAALEDDTSAITMQPDIIGRFPVDDPRLRDEAHRKGKGSVSQRTKKLVHESKEQFSISGPIAPGVSFDFNLSTSPQIDCDRAYRLALFHVRAFFYFITYDKAARRGHLWPGLFMPVAIVQKMDWGNVQMRGFQDLIASWDYRVFASGASDFFKIVIRRSPDERPLWAWAMEWNCNHRLIGFLGDESAAVDGFKRLPALPDNIIHTAPNSYFTFRTEVPLPESEDRLFLFDGPPPAPGADQA